MIRKTLHVIRTAAPFDAGAPLKFGGCPSDSCLARPLISWANKGGQRDMMKLFVAAAVIFVSAGAAFGQVPIDILGSQYQTMSADTVRIRHVAVPGYGNYWIDFRWSPTGFVLVPVNYGPESVATGETWTIPYVSYSGQTQVTITSHPDIRTFDISYRATSGSQFICPSVEDSFAEGNNVFDLSDSLYGIDNTHALITFTTAFPGCGNIYSPQEVKASITQIPAWFDFSQPIGYVFYSSQPVYLQPDGTWHK